MIRLGTREMKSLVAVHGWAGAVLGLLLYAVIVTGTAAVLQTEIKAWSGGLLGTADPFSRPLNGIVERLTADSPKELHDDIAIRVTPSGHLQAYYHVDEKVGGQRKTRGVMYIVSADGAVISRKQGWGEDIVAADPYAALGRFFVDLHVRLHLPNPWGLILTGILGLAMLLAAVSGILMHRHIFKDIFTLRGRQRMVGLRDLHSVAGTWTLPHAFVLAFTGAYFSFVVSIGAPLLARIAFSGNVSEMVRTLNGPTLVDPSPAAEADLDRIFRDARERSGAQLLQATIENRGRADARVSIRTFPRDGELTATTLIYDGATGVFLRERRTIGTQTSAGGALISLMQPLHYGTFGGWWSRAAWIALGAASAYVTWSGLALWIRRRSEQRVWRAIGRMSAWVGGGLPLAMAAAAVAFFVSLPALQTVYWTRAAFLAAAALALVPALIVRPVEKVPPLLFGATGALLLTLPVLRVTVGGPGWAAALASGQNIVPVLDTLVVVTGVVCIVSAALALRNQHRRAAPGHAAMQPAE